MNSVKIVIEHHEDGYVGYPLGFIRLLQNGILHNMNNSRI